MELKAFLLMDYQEYSGEPYPSHVLLNKANVDINKLQVEYFKTLPPARGKKRVVPGNNHFAKWLVDNHGFTLVDFMEV
jgi:hypothetical protein